VLKASCEYTLLCLDAEQFQNIAVKFKKSDFYPSVYAGEFIAALNKLDPSSISDIEDKSIETKALARAVFGDPSRSALTGSHRRSSIDFISKFIRAGRPQPARAEVLGFESFDTAAFQPSRRCSDNKSEAASSCELDDG